MEAAIRSLSETLTGFLGVDAAGAVTGDDDNEPALVTRLSAVAGAAAEAFAAPTATPPALGAPPAHGIWAFGNAASQCRAADDARVFRGEVRFRAGRSAGGGPVRSVSERSERASAAGTGSGRRRGD